jgi:hypothetical protein
VPTPSPVASPAAQLPKNFDPCGGPLELLNKAGNQTACVFVLGEAAITAQYSAAYIPVNSTFNFDTPLGSRSIGLSSAAWAYGYPGSVVYIGVLPRAQLVITPPSSVNVYSTSSSPLVPSPLVAGATDMKFEYKQLAYVNPKTFSMAALHLSYQAPTGSPALSGNGPSYAIEPILQQPLPHNFGFVLNLPVTNSGTVNGPTCNLTMGGPICVPGPISRGWSFAPELTPYWQSPGGTLLAFVVQHSFNPNTTPVVFSAGQLMSRHVELFASYGVARVSASTTTALQGLATASATARPSVFTIGINYLIGRSDLPAALQQ